MRVIGLFVLVLVASAHARAQTGPPRRLAEILPSLVLQDVTLPRPAVDGVSHEVHFSPIESDELNNVVSVPVTLASSSSM